MPVGKCRKFRKLDSRIKCLIDEQRLFVYDNGGRTADRYTVLLNDYAYYMSSDANMPNGVNMVAGEIHEFEDYYLYNEPKHGEQKIGIRDMPEGLKRGIWQRYMED